MSNQCYNNENAVDEPYITPDMWNLYNVTETTISPTGPEYIPKFHNTHVGRTNAHYPREKIDYLQINNYDSTNGPRCKTCVAGCANGVPIKQFGISQKMAYSQGIRKHPECIPGKLSTGRCEIVPNSITQVQTKYNITRHDSNYIGTSKKMAYGKYMRTTPGMETFASKKIPVLQSTVGNKNDCWTNYWCPSL